MTPDWNMRSPLAEGAMGWSMLAKTFILASSMSVSESRVALPLSPSSNRDRALSKVASVRAGDGSRCEKKVHTPSDDTAPIQTFK